MCFVFYMYIYANKTSRQISVGWTTYWSIQDPIHSVYIVYRCHIWSQFQLIGRACFIRRPIEEYRGGKWVSYLVFQQLAQIARYTEQKGYFELHFLDLNNGQLAFLASVIGVLCDHVLTVTGVVDARATMAGANITGNTCKYCICNYITC